MSALPHFSRVDNSHPAKAAAAIAADAAGTRVAADEQTVPTDAVPCRCGKVLASADVRISSLKILAQSIVREIQSLEAEDSASSADTLDLQAEVHRFEAELIRCALVRTQGRQRRAARLLGMKVTTLNAKIRRYKIG